MTMASDQQVRDATIASYKENRERLGDASGIPADPRALEALAVADLTMADNFDRYAKPAPTPSAPAPREERKRSNELDDHLAAATEAGAKVGMFASDDPRKWKRIGGSVLDMPSNEHGERWTFAMGRINRILQPRGSMKGISSFEKLIKECSYPALATDYLELFSGITGRKNVRVAGVFYMFADWSPRDCWRAFVRGVEDVCDRSTGVLGSWYTK